jgi:hypothetical protein
MSDQWRYLLNNTRCGPVSTEELRQLLASGILASSDLVKNTQLPGWRPAAEVLRAIDHPTLPPVRGPQEALPYAAAPDEAIRALRLTEPWAIVFSVVAFLLAAGLMLLAGITMLTFPSGVFHITIEIEPATYVLLTLALAVATALAGFFLMMYAVRIHSLPAGNRRQELVPALRAQSYFWLTLGVAFLVLAFVIGAAWALGAFR